MAYLKLSELPQADVINGSELICVAQGYNSVSISVGDLKEKIKADILNELRAEQAKTVPIAAAAIVGAGTLIAKSPPVTRRFLRMFGK